MGNVGRSGVTPVVVRRPHVWPKRSRLLSIVGALTALAVVAIAPASAYWTSSGTGSGLGATGTLAPPTSVSVPASGSSPVPVGWTASASGVTPTGYYVTRTRDGVTMAACGSSASELVTSTSCSDSAVPSGTYTYLVTAVYRSWQTSSTASGTVTVSNATQVVFTTQPSSVAATAPITPAVAVTVQTAAGAPDLVSGTPVTLAITTNPGGGTLAGTTTAVTDASGVATFAGLSIDRAGIGYQLTATSAGLTSAISTAFTVTVGPAAALEFMTSPTASFAGRTFYDQPVVRVVDAGGNTVTTSTATVTPTLTSPAGATLTCAAKQAVSGIATFTGCSVNSAGTYTLTASSDALAPGASASFSVVAAPTRLAWSGQSTTVCTGSGGTQFALTYTNCNFLVIPGTFTANILMTDAAGTVVTNVGPDVVVALGVSNGSRTPPTLTIPHGQSVSTASTTFSPGLTVLVISGTLTASSASLTSATARLSN